MRRRFAGRASLSVVISAGVHAVFAVGLLFLPEQLRESYDIVDLSVQRTRPEPDEPEPVPVPEPEPEEPAPKPDKPKPRPRPAAPEPEPEPPPAPVPDEDEAPEDAPEAPPVFDLGDNTFAAGKGQGADWSLARSEGNTKFAAVAGKKQQPVRNTKPKTDPNGEPGGKGFQPVAAKNLSKRPMPADGPIKIPAYPAEARREGIEGRVLLQVFIDETGKVYKVRVLKDPGGGLGKVARESMFKERWRPARDKTGKPVDTIITYTYVFVLEG